MISLIAALLGVFLMALNANPPPYPSRYLHAHGFETLVATGLFTSSSHAHYVAHSTTIDRATHDKILINERARFNLTQPRDELSRPMVPFKAIPLSPTTLQITSDEFDVGWDLEYAVSKSSGSIDSDDFVTFSNRQILAISKDGLHLFLVGRVSGGGSSERTIISWTLSVPGDISTAVYNNDAFVYYDNSSAHQDLVFNEAGTKAWFVGADAGSGQNSIYEYSLSTAWDVSTLTAGTILNIGANASTLASAIEISPDGLHIFVADEFTNLVRRWLLDTSFTLSTAVEQVDQFNLEFQETNVTGLVFRDDGTRMFTTGRTTDRIFQYDLDEAWDLNTVVYNDISVNAPFANPTSLSFCDDEFGVSGSWEVLLDGDDGEMFSRKRGGPLKLFQTGSDSELPVYKEGGNLRTTFTEVSGLEDFEGVCLEIGGMGVVANGDVVNQLCSTINPNCVTDGKITLCNRASRLQIGWRYISDVETLDIESQQGTMQGKIKRIPAVTIRFKKSRLGLVGPDKFHLTQMKQRDQEPMGAPTTLLTGDKHVKLEPQWNSNGRIFYRQLDPLPVTILAIIPDLNLEDGPDD